MRKSIGSLFFARVARKMPCLHGHLTSATTASELVSETLPKGGGAYDLDSGYFGKAQPRYMRNLLIAYEKNRKALGLMDYQVVTDATHWSDMHAGHGDPALLVQYPVPMIDIEAGSSPKCWNDETACRALARTLIHVFDDDERVVYNILCVGGIHFDPNFAEAVFTTWNNEAFGVSHILAN